MCSLSRMFWITTALALTMSGQIRTMPSDGIITALPALRIGRNDLVSITVYDSPEFTRVIRVGTDGDLRLPMLKQRIKAEGRMPSELESAIAVALHEENLVVDPVVTVNVSEYQSRPISVAGAVKKPITFQATGQVSLLDALTRAEGLAQDAGSEILVTHNQIVGGTTSSLVQRVSVKGLIDAADPDLNLKLTGGEEIRVPEVGKVFVVGNVKKPGAFRAEGSDTTVMKVLAMAEGLAPYANKRAFIYRREAGSGAKNEIPIELKAILDRKTPDLPLMPNDILYIPDNAGKRASLSALEKLIGFGTATASGVLIWGSR